jgi:hypothetical protein
MIKHLKIPWGKYTLGCSRTPDTVKNYDFWGGRNPPLLRDASSQGGLVNGTARPRDGSSKGWFVQGTHHPRRFIRGHTGRGRNNIPPFSSTAGSFQIWNDDLSLGFFFLISP